MRICYLADGRSVHTYRGLKFFSDRGHQMFLISFAPLEPEHIKAVESAGATYLSELDGFHLKRFWRTMGELNRLRRTFRVEKIDIVHSHFLGINAWYAALSGFHPAVITVMGGDILGENWQPESSRERWLTPFALRKADALTCWSAKLTAIVKRYARPGVPVEVIHGGVDLDLFSPGPRPSHLIDRLGLPPNAKVVFSPRLMRPLYNLDRVAEAARRLCEDDPDVYFVFTYLLEAKDDVYEQRVRDIVEDLVAAKRVLFNPGITHQEMADYYRLATVTISIPSTDGTPMSVLESLACGTPVVVSDIPNYDEHYIEADKTVLVANINDTSEIVSALDRLINDRGLANRLASAGQRRVETSGSYESQMMRMERLYQQLVSKF